MFEGLHGLDDILIGEEQLLIEVIFDHVETVNNFLSLQFVGDLKNENKSIFPPLQRLLWDKLGPLHQNLHIAPVIEILQVANFENSPHQPIKQLIVI